jgi:hypothetical protein
LKKKFEKSYKKKLKKSLKKIIIINYKLLEGWGGEGRGGEGHNQCPL